MTGRAEVIAKSLGNPTREGRGWRCRCPVHDGVSLNLADGEAGKLLVTCWAGCDPLDVLTQLRRLGLADEMPPRDTPEPVPRHHASTPGDTAGIALEIWRQSVDAAGTLAEAYLRGRGLALPPWHNGVLRFNPSCPLKGEKTPALVALFRDIRTDRPCGIHRIALNRDGTRDRERGKAMLGGCGDAAVKLSPDDTVTTGLHIAEGIETGLGLIGFGLAPAWALGSAGGIAKFPVLAGIEALTIAVDHDANGTGDRAALACGARWRQAGREVRLIRSPIVGDDVADLAARVA